MENWCRNRQELSDFIAFVVLYGPNDFPPERNMDMSAAIKEIRAGLQRCAHEIGGSERVAELTNMVEKAVDEINLGNENGGFHILQDVMSSIGN